MPSSIVAAIVSAGIGAAVQGFTIALFTRLFVANLVLGLLSKALAPKPKGGSAARELQDRKIMVRSATEPHRIIYGEAPVSGVMVYAESTGSSKEYLHLIVALAGHECEGVTSIHFNDEKVGDLDGSGNVISGTYSGWARIKVHLGSSTQAADSDLDSESSLWTSQHQLKGITYLYVRLKFDPAGSVFGSGVPNIYAVVRGKKVYDPRTTTTYWTNNWALCLYDYLRSDFGLACPDAKINQTLLASAANISDEWVTMATLAVTISSINTATEIITLTSADYKIASGDKVTYTTTGTAAGGLTSGGTYYATRTSALGMKLSSSLQNYRTSTYVNITSAGTGTQTINHIAQLRYTTNGTFQLSERPVDIIEGLLTSAAGSVVWTAGSWEVYPAAYITPVYALDESSLRGDLTVKPRASRKELFNAVRGIYSEPNKAWQATDFPLMENSTYATQDGEVIYRDIEVPHCTDQVRAQRIAKIHLEKSRQGIIVELPLKLLSSTFRLKVMTTFTLSIAHLGWVSKVFRVMEWKLSETGGIDILAQEESSDSYNWANGDATVVDPAPDTILPNLAVVSPPTSLVAASGSTHQFIQPDGITICQLYLTWTAAADANVIHYEVQWKKTTDSVYQSAVVGGNTTAYISPVVPGVSYHVRVRGLTAAAYVSAWEGPVTIAASSDASTVSASVAYADITGTKPPADADKTVTAIQAGATVTSGGITFNAGGNIKGGQTDYNTGTGWFLGYSGGAYKFSIGDPAGSRMVWTGTDLLISGNILNTYIAGDTLLIGGSSRSVSVSSWVNVATFTINEGMGTVRVWFQFYNNTASESSAYYVTKNGITIGSGSNGTNVAVTVSIDTNISFGDVISIYGRRPGSIGFVNMKYLQIKYGVPSASVNTVTYS